MPLELIVFFKSLLIGLSIAAPVGPIGLLVIQRTLQRGIAVGLATGLGAAVADAVYGAVGAFGVGAVTGALQSARVPLAAAGAAVLLWLAWGTWRAPPADAAAPASEGPGVGRGLAGAFAGTFVLTLSNPATIFSFMAVFATVGAGSQGASPWTMIAGVLLGSAVWWLFLCGLIARLRHVFDAPWRQRINRAAAVVLAVFAAWTLATLAR